MLRSATADLMLLRRASPLFLTLWKSRNPWPARRKADDVRSCPMTEFLIVVAITADSCGQFVLRTSVCASLSLAGQFSDSIQCAQAMPGGIAKIPRQVDTRWFL